MDQRAGDRWKRGNDWRDGPAFLDATSSVSASTFAARRLPELKNLYFQTRFVDESNDDSIIHERKNHLSGGGKRSSRHLRRRTTAIQSKRHRHRYPEHVPQPAYKGATRKSKRKKRSLLEDERFQWLHSNKGMDHRVAINEDKTSIQVYKSWLVTHLWHSKRFHVLSSSSSSPQSTDPVFRGWTGIPLVHCNRGPRAALRLSQNRDESNNKTVSVLVRDVTWERQPLFLVRKEKKSKHQSVQLLLQSIGMICPGIVQRQGENLEPFLSGKLSIEETVYEPNAFPSGAIGPAVWRILPTVGETAVEIRCHPSIRPRIQEILLQLAKSVDDSHTLETEIIPKGVPRICFRLYGMASTNVLNSTLRLEQGEILDFLKRDQNGSILSVKNVEIAAKNNHESEPNDDITLIYRAPRPLDCPANCAMAGWEIHCSNAAFAKSLWVALVTFDDNSSTTSSTTKKCDSVRGCCAIGLIEDCHMRLECEPPIPIFPRDFVDTHDSQTYWMPSSSSSSSSWKRIRQLCEGGWGRLPVDKESCLDKLESIDFSDLIDIEGDESETEEGKNGGPGTIVAVRGAFGQPFVDAIQGSCGNYTPKTPDSSQPNANQRRRKRRASRPKNQTIVAPPLSRSLRNSLGDYCQRLISSLSLPAVLLVHIRAVGNGVISPGMSLVCADSNSTVILGRITAGSFSPSRGICHGIGAVGAVRLLEYLGRITNDEEAPDSSVNSNLPTSYGRIVRLANGSQSLQLLVRVVKTTDEGEVNEGGFEASLTALI